jgi:hypothetical protein
MTRRDAKVDANQEAIVEALRAIGVSVQSLAKVGEGCPDLLCGVNKVNFLLEVKDPDSSRGIKLLPKQKDWHANWRGRVHLAITPDIAVAIAENYRLLGGSQR